MAGATLIATTEQLATPELPTPELATPELATQGKSIKSDPRHIYSCPECGHVLRVSGLGRHRVYFELTDERSSRPVMNRVCPACGDGLPGKNTP
jgi:ribosomal protein S27AE